MTDDEPTHEEAIANVTNILDATSVAERRTKFNVDPDRAKVLDKRGPFAAAAPLWFNAGWSPLPLPKRLKTPPPEGYTGHDGKVATYDQLVEWITHQVEGNIAIRMPHDVVGLDVDAYKDAGMASWEALVEECGPLPETYVATSRTDRVSGIRLFRVPPGTVLKGAPMPGIECIQFHHRYMITGPSVHPETGERYRLWNQATGEDCTYAPPERDDLPMMPSTWVERLKEQWRAPIEQIVELPRERKPLPDDSQWARPVDDALVEAEAQMSAGFSRHDAALTGSLVLLRFEERGFPGASQALDHLGDTFRMSVSSAVPDKRQRTQAQAAKEWRDIVESGRDIIRRESPQMPDFDSYKEAAEWRARPKADVTDIVILDNDGEPVTVARDSGDATTTSEVEPKRDRWKDIPDDIRAQVTNDAMAVAIRKKVEDKDAARLADALIDYWGAQEAKPFNDGLLSEMTDPPTQWRISELLPEGGRLLFVAQRKTGKTSIALNVLRVVCHGDDHFLGMHTTDLAGNIEWQHEGFRVAPIEPDARVGFLNYELARPTFNTWAREAGLPEERMYINHLRGGQNPFRLDRDLNRQIERLVDNNVKVLVVDPAARAFYGPNLNDTSAVIDWTNAVDYMAEEAHISEVIVTNHAGWDKERGRNSTVFEDWADTIVTMVTEEEQTDAGPVQRRFFSAIGRDVEIVSQALSYDPERRTFGLTGETRTESKKRAREDAEGKSDAKRATMLQGIVDRATALFKGNDNTWLSERKVAAALGIGSKDGRVAEALTGAMLTFERHPESLAFRLRQDALGARARRDHETSRLEPQRDKSDEE